MSEQLTFESVHAVLRASGYVDANQAAALTYQLLELSTHHAAPGAPQQDCPNCFEGKSDMDHDCRVCGGTGRAAATAPALVITLRQAEHLLEFFGGHDAEIAVSREAAGRPPGLYVWCVDCPEEGSMYLGPTEVDDELADKGRPVAATAPAGGVTEPTQRMEVESYRRALLVWHDASEDEIKENIAGLRLCLRKAARILLEHPALTTAARAAEPVAEVVDMKYNAVKFYRKNAQGDSLPYLQPGTKLCIAASPTPPTGAARAAEPEPTPGMAVQALAGEIVAALLADEKDGGYDLTAGLFGPEFSKLVRRWAAVEFAASPTPPTGTSQGEGTS